LPPGAANTTADANKRFEYTYDGRDNMLTKKVPDQDFPVKMLYNARDQMVFLQDPVMSQTSGGKWLLNLYDDYGRPIKTGFATYTGTSPSPSAPGTHSEVHTETVYGTVGIEKGKITQGKVYIPGLATPITRTMTFDAITGRMLTNNGNNHLTSATGSDNYTYTYDYAGNVLTEARTHKTSPTATALTLTSRKTYDHSGRNTNLHHKINSNSEKQLANYAYDFRDRIIDKSLGQHTGTVGGVPTSGFLQSLDYTYNEQNWLTGINSASTFAVSEKAIVACATNPLAVGPLTASFAANPDGNDLFKMSLNYDAPQTFTGQPVAPTGQRNGNISQLVWQVRGRERQAYNVTYDFLDRMLNATYMDITSGGTANTSNRYQENLTYADMRGNINTLTRNGMFKSTTTATCYTLGQIDNLAYTYVTGTNRLSKIADAAGTANSTQRNAGFNPAAAASTATYTYDVNGNMTNDPYKSLAISYNHLNLPTVFNFGGGKSIGILYDRGGMKLRKTVNNTGVVTLYKQDYVSGLEYRSNGSAGALTLEAIYHPEGRITPNGAAFRYEYNIKDHLGNTRLTFADINNNGAVDMGYDWMNNTAISPDTKYQYNGKEFNDDFGLNWNDYGARWYLSELGRFPNTDPLSDTFNFVTPYNYAENSPVTFIDLWGLQRYKPKMNGNPLNNAYEGMKTIGYEFFSTIGSFLPGAGSSSAEDYTHKGTGIEMLSDINVPGNGTLSLPNAENGADKLIGTGDIIIPLGGGSGGLAAIPEIGFALNVVVDGASLAKDAESISAGIVQKDLESKVEKAKIGTSKVADMRGDSFLIVKTPIDTKGMQKATATPIPKSDTTKKQ
jgi:RHS repeat-associated protein